MIIVNVYILHTIVLWYMMIFFFFYHHHVKHKFYNMHDRISMEGLGGGGGRGSGHHRPFPPTVNIALAGDVLRKITWKKISIYINIYLNLVLRYRFDPASRTRRRRYRKRWYGMRAVCGNARARHPRHNKNRMYKNKK